MKEMVVLEHAQNFLTTGVDATSHIDWMENSDILDRRDIFDLYVRLVKKCFIKPYQRGLNTDSDNLSEIYPPKPITVDQVAEHYINQK